MDDEFKLVLGNKYKDVNADYQMGIFKKAAGKVYRNLKVLRYSLFTPRAYKVAGSKSKFLWNRAIATSCGAWPVYFPVRREVTDTFWGNLFLLTPLFVRLSYGNINAKLSKNNTIYVSLNEMGTFIKKVLPKIRKPFVLVTGDSDYSTSRFKAVLKNKYLIHWFAQNNDIKSEKVSGIPLGLDLHTIIDKKFFGEGRKSAAEQESALEGIRKVRIKPELKVFTNFHLNLTSNRRRDLHGDLKDNRVMHFQKRLMPRGEMWKMQKKYAFNFSPVGNGLDCVRTWEALALWQIPIIERTGTALDDLYRQFPIVLIDDVSEINEKSLRKWYRKYSKMFGKDLEKKLTNDYWVGLIREAQGFQK